MSLMPLRPSSFTYNHLLIIRQSAAAAFPPPILLAPPVDPLLRRRVIVEFGSECVVRCALGAGADGGRLAVLVNRAGG
jgi:hypothetical protein